MSGKASGSWDCGDRRVPFRLPGAEAGQYEFSRGAAKINLSLVYRPRQIGLATLSPVNLLTILGDPMWVRGAFRRHLLLSQRRTARQSRSPATTG